MSLLAVDMGSSSCKAVAFSETGAVLAHETHSYASESPHPSWSEMPPEEFWHALVSSTRPIGAKLIQDPVEALAISSHGETFFPVDNRNNPVGRAILNADNRAVREANGMAEEIGRERIFEITGLTAHPMYPLPKILWLRKHQPTVFSGAARFLSVPGFLLSCLGLPPYVDHSLASRFLAFDIRSHCWSTDILAHCDLRPDQLPATVPTGTIAGELSEKAAAALGLKQGTPVVLGGHDQPCAALGSGVLDEGRVSASLGTYECLLAASSNPSLNERALAANLNSYCHVIPDRYVTLAYFPSGIMVDWFLRLFHSESEKASSFDLFASMERCASVEPSGLFIAPHLFGTCNPDFDPQASGVIAGIRPTTSRADLYQGVIEGMACEFANMANLLQQANGDFRDVYISGGGGRSRLGLRLRAALANRTLHLMQSQEAVCLGTAILAGVAIGKYRNFGEAVERMVRISETVVPDCAIAKKYKHHQAQYQLLYSSLAAFRRAQDNWN